MSLHLILLFSVTVFIASIIPGPSMLLALTNGINHGAKRTIASALGNVTVTVLQASVSVAGLGTILIASETAFQIVKWAGAVYLIYIGVIMLFSSQPPIPSSETNHNAQVKSSRKLYLQAVFVTSGNPKAIVFFTAVFPQFITPGTAYLPQFCTLVSLLAFIAFNCFMLYAICGQKMISLFSRTAIWKKINRVIGGTFIGTGISLVGSNK